MRLWVEHARAERTQGQERADEGGARGAGAAAQGESHPRRGARHPKKSHGLLREAEPVRFRFIAAEKARHTVTILCRCLQRHAERVLRLAPAPGIDARAGRSPAEGAGARVVRREPRHYGSPRIHEDLIEQQERVSRKRVIRLMQEDGLKARVRKRYKVHDDERSRSAGRGQSARPAVHRRRARISAGSATRPSSSSASSGKLYLAAILDLFSRFIVGWAVSAVNDRHLTIKALEMALKRRCPDAGLAASLRPGLHVRQRGLPGASSTAHGITCSMSRRGNCYDNAVMESFFSTVKSELGERFESHGDAKMELFDYIEVFYNQRRRHSTLGQISPAAFERQAVTQAA